MLGTYIAPTDDRTGEVSDTIVKKLAVKAMLLTILIARYTQTLNDGNSKISSPVKCNIGNGIQRKRSVKRPIPVVHAFENMMERYGPIGDTAHALALYNTSYNPYNIAPNAMI